MDHIQQLEAEGIDAYLEAHEHKALLRFITCGSVDDGKSTLIGRLLYESKQIYEDQLAALQADSAKMGTQGQKLDLALLVDGLAAEREQGITIDVAYRYFSTKDRKFIVADTPGHEQYTRNMVTGASTADAAIILLDARKGILTQTRRHTYICTLLGIRHLVLAVNKMDLVGYSEEVFDAIQRDYRELATSLGAHHVSCIPVSALEGDNVIQPSPNLAWYQGAPLLGLLESLSVETDDVERPFRLPIQWVNRSDSEFRGFSGYLTSGKIRPGDSVVVLPANTRSTIKSLHGPHGGLAEAVAGQSITVTLQDEVDVSRGDLLVPPERPAGVSKRFSASVVWMHEQPMLPGRPYLLKLGTRTVTAHLEKPEHKVNVNTFELLPTETLELNDIGVCHFRVDRPLPFDPYSENRDTGGFILIDRLTNDTVGAGMLDSALRGPEGAEWRTLELNRHSRAALKGQRACAVWLTGAPRTNTSILAKLLEQRLHADGIHTALLDADQTEDFARVADLARALVDAGLVVLASVPTKLRAERQRIRDAVGSGEFLEVYLHSPGEEPGHGSFEAPQNPELRLETSQHTPEQLVELLRTELERLGRLRT